MTGQISSVEKISRDEVISFFSGELEECLKAIPLEVLAMTPEELETAYPPGTIDYFLRKNIWSKVREAKKLGETKLFAADIYNGVCHATNFHKRVIKNPIRLAWLLFDPLSEMDKAEEALLFGLMRVRNDLLTMPMNDKTAPHILKAVELLWNRVRGPVIQKIEAKHAHLDLNKPIADNSPVDILKRLDELKAKLLNPSSNVEIAEVTIRDVVPVVGHENS